MTSHIEEVMDPIQDHPEGLDNDISEISGIRPRQQIQQLCSELAACVRPRRESLSNFRTHRKIHTCPIVGRDRTTGSGMPQWMRRLSGLVAAGRSGVALLDKALEALAIRILAAASESQ